jgi:hypothetical protein
LVDNARFKEGSREVILSVAKRREMVERYLKLDSGGTMFERM